MTLSVNAGVFLTVDEQMGVTGDADEVTAAGALVTADAALATAALAIPGAAPTATFTTTQFAVETGLFNIGANTTNLQFAASSGNPPSPFPTTAGNGINSGLTTVEGTAIYLFQGANSNIVYGAIGNNPANAAAFVLVLDETFSGSNVTSAKLWIVQYAALKHSGQNVTEGDLLDLTDKVYVASTTLNSAVFSDFGDVPSGSPVFAMIADDTNANPIDFLVTAFNTPTPGTSVPVNISTQGSFPGSLASGSQNMTPGTSLRFDTVKDGNNAYSQSQGNSDTNIAFDTHQNVVQAGFSVVQNQGSRPTDLKIEAWNSLSDTADGHAFFTSVLNQASLSIDKILVSIINPDTGALTPLWDSSNAAHASHFVVSGNAITVKDCLLNYTIEIVRAGGFDRFTVANVDSQQNAYVDLGRLTFTTQDTVADVDEVGSRIQIDDSGPTISTTGTVPTFAVDESGLAAGTDSGNPGQTTATHSVAANFTSAFGSDGAGVLGYKLKVVDGTDSGLDDVATGQNILLRLNASGVVEGYTAVSNAVAFTVAIDSDGVAPDGGVTLTLLRPIKHDPGGIDEAKTMAANLIKVEATIVDKEGATTGDSATAEISISDKFNFEDDEPSVTGQDANAGTLAVDDDVLGAGGAATANYSTNFSPVFGADGPHATDDVVYTLSAVAGGTGIFDCATDLEVQLKVVSGSVIGYVKIANVDTTVFTVGVNADTGVVTLTQARAIRHLDGLGDPTNTPATLNAADLISLTATVKDKDVDTAQATIDVSAALSFADAQPEITTPADIDLKFATGQSKTENFTANFHNDTPGTVGIASYTYNGPLLDVQVGATRINFYDDKGTASTADDVLVHHVTVSATGYTVTVDNAPASEPVGLNFNAIKAGGPQEILTVPLNDNTDSIVFDGFLNGAQDPGDGDFLNPDSVGFGVKNGQASQINPTESFSFHRLSGDETESLQFDVQGIGGIKNVRVNWRLYDDNGTPNNSADDILVDSGTTGFISLPSGNNVVPVSIIDDGAASTAAGFAANSTAGETFDYGIVYFDFPANQQGVVVANQGIRVLDFATTSTPVIDPETYTLTLVAEDCDEDVITTNLITVTIDPTFV